MSEGSRQRIGLALQGGGAHGAFTWGVLDRMLQSEAICFDHISGTSSGALNALALAQGWMDGGRDGARACLERMWTAIGGHPSAAEWIFGARAQADDDQGQPLHRYFSSNLVNQLTYNPVRQIGEALFDFDRLRATTPFPLHLAATRIRDGALILFDTEQLCIDALLASTCLPQIFEPVTIDGETYWDGGWAGNPVLEPLIYEAGANTLLCILVQPLTRKLVPVSAEAITKRMSELGFSCAFLRELRTIVIARDKLDESPAQSWLGRRVQNLQIHLIEPGEPLESRLPRAAGGSATDFMAALHAHGRECAEQWLANPRAHQVTRETAIIGGRPA